MDRDFSLYKSGLGEWRGIRSKRLKAAGILTDHQRVSREVVDRLALTCEVVGDTGGRGDSFEYNLRTLLDWVDVHKARTGS